MVHAGACRAALGTVGEEGDDRVVPHDAPAVAGRRHGGLGKLLRCGLGERRAVGEGEHRVAADHVKGTADRGDPRRHSHGPKRGADRVSTRKRRPADHDVRPLQADQRGTEGQGMLQGFRRRRVAGEALGMVRAEQADHLGERGAGSRTLQELDGPEPQPFNPFRGLPHAGVVPFGKHDAPASAPGPLVQRIAKRHRPSFFLSACCTAGWTRLDTSPPKRATSRTRLELKYVRSNAGTRKTVSMPGARLRFMRAIWNSYSKSLTARKPRTITVAPAARANSASSPSKDRTSTPGSS